MKIRHKSTILTVILIICISLGNNLLQDSAPATRSTPSITKIDNVRNKLNQVSSSPFYLISHDEIITYSPIMLLPNFEWYQANGLSFNSSDYLPIIYINNSIAWGNENKTHQELCTSGFCWNNSEFSRKGSISIRFDLYFLDDLIISESIAVRIDIPDSPVYEIAKSEIRFGLVSDPYSSTNKSTDLTYIYYPDGFILRYFISPQGESETWVVWTTEDEYLQIFLLFEQFDFCSFSRTYIDQLHENDSNLQFISLTLWNADGTYSRYSTAYAGKAIPNFLTILWINLTDLIELYEDEFVQRTYTTELGFSFLLISLTLLFIRISRKPKPL